MTSKREKSSKSEPTKSDDDDKAKKPTFFLFGRGATAEQMAEAIQKLRREAGHTD
jgi:uncharacterized alpha/beta hydrolase family protein